jgi:DNA-binding PucR family transcriptional regulator
MKENLNVSEAAKKLYIHRNSMQYRLEKFSERTGLDIRKFDDAVNIHLAILALGNLHNN